MADLSRFLSAQESSYDTALSEIRNGRKQSHWIWYIFPQLRGLGLSGMAQRYGISGLEEARAYLEHTVLGKRLREISAALLSLQESDPHQIMGSPDDLKLRSSMTLFAYVEPGTVFQDVLDKFYNGIPDEKTLQLLDQLA
jgi:uncharacterized protein (DUF1810 family)